MFYLNMVLRVVIDGVDLDEKGGSCTRPESATCASVAAINDMTAASIAPSFSAQEMFSASPLLDRQRIISRR